jgi:hypothetical protein
MHKHKSTASALVGKFPVTAVLEEAGVPRMKIATAENPLGELEHDKAAAARNAKRQRDAKAAAARDAKQ